MVNIHETSSGATFAVKVHPRAKTNTFTGELGDALKLSLTVPPVEGRANEACIEFFAKSFEGSTIVRYHSVRPDQPQEDHPCRGRVRGGSQAEACDMIQAVSIRLATGSGF